MCRCANEPVHTSTMAACRFRATLSNPEDAMKDVNGRGAGAGWRMRGILRQRRWRGCGMRGHPRNMDGHDRRLRKSKYDAAELVVLLQLYQRGVGMAAGIVAIGHAALAALLFLLVPVVNGGQLAHAIMHVDNDATGNGEVEKR